MHLTQKSIKIGNKIRKIVLCPPDFKESYYRKHVELSNLFEENPFCEYVHCRIGRSVISNAKPHIGFTFTLKMDLKNFFYNITVDSHGQYIPKEYHRFVFYRGRVPQGLPTSPSVANLAFAVCDKQIAEFCKKKKVIYTRYCDDLSFSFNDYTLADQLKKKVSDIVSGEAHKINTRKTKLLYAKAGRRIICGVGVGETKLHATRKSKRNLRTYKKNGQELAAQGMQAWINYCESE